MTKMFMRKFIGLSASLLFLFGCQQPAPTQTPADKAAAASAAPTQSPVERGKYLTTVGGCNDCHTPKKIGPNGPEADMTRELSGNPSTEKVAGVPPGVIAPDKWLTVANNQLGHGAGPRGGSFAMNIHATKESGV